MEEELSKQQLFEMIDKTLNVLENNFKNRATNKIPISDTFSMVKDLYVLFTNFEKYTKECGKIIIKRYIPLLDFLIKFDNDDTHLVEYNKLLKYSYKLGARISLEHYMVYREWDIPEKEKLFEPRYEILVGYIHYLEEIVLNPRFYTLIFNCPSGYGKTYPEKISEAWGFGIDPTGSILALCSNDDVVKSGSRSVIDEIKSEWFGEVFPNLKYDENDKNFFLKETDEKWKLKQCKLAHSYYAKTTNSNVVGSRANRRIHIDDLYPDYKEALNQQLNQYYFNKSLTVWEKRFVQDLHPKVVITGTLWASGDYIDLKITQLKKEHKFHKHPKYKYTWVSEDESCVIIQVPALDYQTGVSTCPELKSTAELLKEKANLEEYIWETNFQQRPTDPESLFFSYHRLKTYDVIPDTDYKGSYAVIDATRKSGKDFFAMPIFTKVANGDLMEYYLKDCVFSREATKDMYDVIVDKIIDNHIIYLVIESNVTSELAKAISDRLKTKSLTFCEIAEKYNTVPKPVRIETEKGVIKKQLIFPQKGMYGVNTDMGRFMDNLTIYNNSGTNLNDDAPDSCAMFCSEIIEENAITQKAEPLAGIREYF